MPKPYPAWQYTFAACVFVLAGLSTIVGVAISARQAVPPLPTNVIALYLGLGAALLAVGVGFASRVAPPSSTRSAQ